MGAWPYRMPARERLLLQRQTTNDRRNIRPVWLHVFKVEESPLDTTYLQTSKHLRKFLDPIPAYLYIEPTDESETIEPGTEHKLALSLTFSRAETFRLAQVLSELLGWTEEQYRLRAQDVVQWRDELYEIQDVGIPKEHWGTTNIPVLYEAPASTMALDSNAASSPLTILEEQPPLVYPKDFSKAEPDGENTDETHG